MNIYGVFALLSISPSYRNNSYIRLIWDQLNDLSAKYIVVFIIQGKKEMHWQGRISQATEDAMNSSEMAFELALEEYKKWGPTWFPLIKNNKEASTVP